MYTKEQFIRSVEPWHHYDKTVGGGREMLVYGAYDEEGRMCGYAHLVKYKDHCSLSTLKTRPSSDSKGINAAICNQILKDLEEDLSRNDFLLVIAQEICFTRSISKTIFKSILDSGRHIVG